MKKATLGQAAKILSLFRSTPKEQMQALLRSGLLADLRDANIAAINRDEVRRVFGLKPLPPPLLEYIGKIAVPPLLWVGVMETFLECFKASIKVYFEKSPFKNRVLARTEESMTETKLSYAMLTRNSADSLICAEIGAKFMDEKFMETKLSQIFALVELQQKGEPGPLLNNGAANIFYVKDVDGVLCSLGILWIGEGWRVFSYSNTHVAEWFCGSRVFFPA